MLNISDSVEYVVSATRMVQGQGLTVTVNGVPRPTRYPFGFPLLLTPAMWLSPGSPVAAVLTVWACAVACLVLALRIGRRLVGGPRGWVAGMVIVALIMSLHQFTRLAQVVMSDVPLLLATLVLLDALVSVQTDRRLRSYLIGGLAVGVAVTMRLTSLAYALPLLWLAWRDPRSSWKTFLAACLGPLLALTALFAYDTRVFGAPLYTGYHYWLRPSAYALGLRYLPSNLRPMVDPLGNGRVLSMTLLGGGALIIAACAIVIAYRWAEGRSALRPVVLFLLLGSLPGCAFFLLYPHHMERFHLTLHTGLAVGGGASLFLIWRSTRWLHALALLALWLAAFERPAGRIDPYRRDVMNLAARELPADAVLISDLHGVHFDLLVRRETQRTFLPLSDRTSFGGWKVGRHGEERKLVYPFIPIREPERLVSLLEQGRRVFVELGMARRRGRGDYLEELERLFRLEPELELNGETVIAELFPLE